jgi:uncharacterized pyridoxamine 5'-phosphate oxidase family protein
METTHFKDIQTEFMERAQRVVYCNMATVDLKGRPRSRIIHAIWNEEPIGWVITAPGSPKLRHLANNPHVSLAYIGQMEKPIYIEATASWVESDDEKWRIWEFIKSVPEPMGFDPGPSYGDIHHKYFGLLCFTPWRIELAQLHAESLIWRPDGAGKNG